jgi:protocatechuate 3,4-dioxygenase beta subunit
MQHEDHEARLEHDLEVLTRQTLNRRRALLWLAAGAGALPILAACGSDLTTATDATGTTTTGTTDTTSSGTTSTGTSADGSCTVIPEETAGPYPGDGSNGANALILSGIVRSAIASSFAGATGVAVGIPLKIEITLVNASGSCAELEGYAVYLWHCDRSGQYSMYSSAVKNENYLRGIQASDADGKLSFESIYPGCYDGRWPHIHFEVYKSLSAATSVKNKIATSQIALPASASKLVYATSNYTSSVSNFNKANLSTDNVFSDGSSLQLPTVEGNVTDGFTVKLTVAVKG